MCVYNSLKRAYHKYLMPLNGTVTWVPISKSTVRTKHCKESFKSNSLLLKNGVLEELVDSPGCQLGGIYAVRVRVPGTPSFLKNSIF